MRAAIIALLLVLPGLPHVEASVDPFDAALSRALDYLEENALDGNEYLVEAVVGAGADPGLWPSPEANVLDALVIPEAGAFNDPIREIHAVAQSGYDPYGFGERDLVEELRHAWAESSQGVGQASFTVLGLHAAGVPRGDDTLEETVGLLQQSQFANGGWSCWGLPSPDCTGFALTALASTDAFLPGMQERARLWLDANRLPNGGYASGGHLGSLTVAGVPLLDAEGANTQSTIWAIHGYRAIGDPAPTAAMAYLLGRQMPDGGFAWRDADTRSDAWATMEVVAGWTRSFHELPVYKPTEVSIVREASVGLPMEAAIDGFAKVTWRDLGEPATLLEGPQVAFTLSATGAHTVHVDARGEGFHHRARVDVLAYNMAPVFLDLPREVTVEHHGDLRLDLVASDADGHDVQITWSFQEQQGEGDVLADADARGDHMFTVHASDAFGATTTDTVLVHVVNPAGR